MAYFAPTIVSGLGYEDLDAQLFTVPPYAVAYPITLLAAWLSDRYKDRGIIATIACGCACISFIIQGKALHSTFVNRLLMNSYSCPPCRCLPRPVRVPDHRHNQRLCRPAIAQRLGRRQRPHHNSKLPHHRPEHCILGARSDHWCLDLQDAGCPGLPSRTWGQCRHECRCYRAGALVGVILPSTEQEDPWDW